MALTHVRIVGSGLIGTSIGLALVQKGVAVTMVDSDERAQKLARDLLKSGADSEVEVTIIATPIGAIKSAIEGELATSVKYGFIDIASVKDKVKVEVQSLGLSTDRFLPTHPMAGREVGGAESARADLFQGRPWVIDSALSSPELKGAALELLSLLGAEAIEMESAEHDMAVALVSHLPQIISSILASRLEAAPAHWLALSGSGLRDTVRIAGSDPALWREILTANAQAIAPLLREVVTDCQSLLANLSDETAVSEVIAAGQRGRNQIPGKHGGKARSYTQLPIVIEDKPGQLAALFDECARVSVNVEDLTIEHSPGQFTGLITLALSAEDARTLSKHLSDLGWSVHSPR